MQSNLYKISFPSWPDQEDLVVASNQQDALDKIEEFYSGTIGGLEDSIEKANINFVSTVTI